MLIFLDFDGVLHSAHHYTQETMFSQLPILERFFQQEEFAHARFVISSTWRQGRDLAQLRAIFSPNFQERIIGKTPSLPRCTAKLTGSREREILQYCQIHGFEQTAWLALDDMRGYFDQYLDRLFLCQASTGLTEADLPRLAQQLRAIQSA